MGGSHGEGRHTTLDKDTRRSVDWLHLQAGVKRIILGPIDVCKHAFTPGTLRIKREMPGGLELKAYFGVGIRPLYCYLTPGMATHITGRIQERFYPRVRFTAPKVASAFAPEVVSLRDADFDKALAVNGFTWTPPIIPTEVGIQEPALLPPIIPIVEEVSGGIREDVMATATEKKRHTMPTVEFYTVEQAAKKMGCSTAHVRHLLHKGIITGAQKVGAGPSGFTLLPAATITARLHAKLSQTRKPRNGASTPALHVGSLQTTITKLNEKIERLSTLLDMVLDSATSPKASLSAATRADEGVRG